MKLQVYSVFDIVAKVFSQPFYMASTGQALRGFGDEVNNPNSMLSKHPGDFKLFKLAEFDDNTGKFISIEPEFLCNAVDFVPPKKEAVNA